MSARTRASGWYCPGVVDGGALGSISILLGHPVFRGNVVIVDLENQRVGSCRPRASDLRRFLGVADSENPGRAGSSGRV